MRFSPISVSDYVAPGRNIYYRTPCLFGDRRLACQYRTLSDRMLNQQSLVIHQLSTDRNEANCFYRFLSHKKVDIQALIDQSCTISPSVLSERHVLVLGDSTSFTLDSHIGRIKDSDRIGEIGGHHSRGFQAHAHIGVDAQNGDILGMADLLLWSRSKDMLALESRPNWPDRESYKWALGMRSAAKVLAPAQGQTYVLDQDADHMALFSYNRALETELGLKLDFVIRQQYNRLFLWKGELCKSKDILAQEKVLGRYELDLPKLDHYSSSNGKRIRRQARRASMQLKIAEVEVKSDQGKKHPIWLIEAQEITPNLPPSEKPINWVLLTTHPSRSFDEAQEIIRYYCLRWVIEQWFRTLKSEGLQLEETELSSFDAILRQTVMAFKTAARILQLVYARNRFDAQPIETAFNPQEQLVLETINQQLQGKTHKQQNPFPKEQLSWAVWVIARLGGWKGYQSQRPPGPITIKKGIQKFDIYLKAFHLFNPPDG